MFVIIKVLLCSCIMNVPGRLILPPQKKKKGYGRAVVDGEKANKDDQR